MSRNEEIDLKAKMCFNVCPICWMPLELDGLGLELEKWGVVQLIWKSKPAFAVYDFESEQHISRAINAFGHHHLAQLVGRTLKSNLNKCHFVHYCMFEKAPRTMDTWRIGDGAGNARYSVDGLHIRSTTVMDDRLTNDGFMRKAMNGAQTDAFMRRVLGDRYNERAIPRLAENIFKGKFAGCADCNNQMTIADYLRHVFDLIFEGTYNMARGSTIRKNNLDECIHFIMLTGVLERGDIVRNGLEDPFFPLPSSERQRTWTLKYVLMWCALQILFCKWHIVSMPLGIRHHQAYLFLGVMDFYFSLWLYALHYVRTTDGRFDSLNFEEFHFYYASCFAMHKNPSFYNLSLYLMRRSVQFGGMDVGFDDENFWAKPDTVDKMNTQMGIIFYYMQNAWTDEMRQFSDEIHSDFAQSSDAVKAFFQSPRNVVRRREWAVSTVLKFGEFADPHPGDYWFHFKNITFRRIRVLCIQMDHELHKHRMVKAGAAKLFMWRRWYGVFSYACAQLWS